MGWLIENLLNFNAIVCSETDKGLAEDLYSEKNNLKTACMYNQHQTGMEDLSNHLMPSTHQHIINNTGLGKTFGDISSSSPFLKAAALNGVLLKFILRDVRSRNSLRIRSTRKAKKKNPTHPQKNPHHTRLTVLKL